jgi:hypothetical protein
MISIVVTKVTYFIYSLSEILAKSLSLLCLLEHWKDDMVLVVLIK